MKIEFDPAKNEIDRDKHGVSLSFGRQVFLDSSFVIVSSTRVQDGEDRHKAIGMVGNRLWTAVYVERGSITRFISVRKVMNKRLGDMIAIPADPNDPEDFDVTEAALRKGLRERDRRLRGLQQAPTKQQVTLRIDQDVLAKFRGTGPGWQGRINAVLKAASV